jgi:hypothetical protein
MDDGIGLNVIGGGGTLAGTNQLFEQLPWDLLVLELADRAVGFQKFNGRIHSL